MTGSVRTHTAAITNDPRWTALAARDSRADGAFVYSVSTTGVYCRPSCPSRRARPEHVRFHASAADAQRAGFRACKRCRPDEPSPSSERTRIVTQACRFLEAAETVPTLAELAREAGLSPYHLHRLFKEITGLTPRAYAAAHRARRMREALRGGDSVTQAAYASGYQSLGRFYADTHAELGMTPRRYRNGGADVAIRFALGECSLGHILVASSPHGVCAILMGDDPDALLRDLQERFPSARLIGGDGDFEQTVAQVVGFVEAPSLGLDLPLDIRGTAFQRRVWEALRAIPAGQTLSYAELAERICLPQAARAVAGACAANPLAVAIPCHRVVRKDGGLSGYRWGVERKRELLRRERPAGKDQEAGSDRRGRTMLQP